MSEAEYGKYRDQPAAARPRGQVHPSSAAEPVYAAAHPDAPQPQYALPPGAIVLSRGQRLLNLLGAVGSVALVAGLGWWGWDLAMRDARGVPVVRALEGPMRIAPEDPGGRVVDHQGLSVNEVAAEGGVAPPADRLVLAPAPVELTLEDAPGLVSASAQPGAAAGGSGAVGAQPGPATADPLSTEMANMPDQLADPSAPVPVTPSVTEPDAVALALAEALGLSPEDIPTAQPAAPSGNLNRSLRPKARPGGGSGGAGAAAAVAASTGQAPPASKPNEIDAATLSPGARLVQFGAYDSRELAEAEWLRLAGRFGTLMASKSMVVQSAESGGQTFWRLRAHGFENEQDSRRFCAALEAEGAKCIPVAHR